MQGHQHDAGPLKACNGQSPGEAVVTPITLLLATTTRLENHYENHLFIVLLSITAYVFKNSYKCSRVSQAVVLLHHRFAYIYFVGTKCSIFCNTNFCSDFQFPMIMLMQFLSDTGTMLQR